MTADEWRRLQNLFESLMERAPEEREAQLQAIERSMEPSLGRELRRLVEHADACSGFLEPAMTFTPPPEAPSPPAPGDWIGDRFQIVRPLGRGGMGEVFEALDSKLQEPVALKVILSEYARSEQSSGRLLREVRMARKITHVNVCRIYDVGEHCGNPYFTMELLRGQTLAERLKSEPRISLWEWHRLAEQLFDGLRAAHEAGVVHRDLKPSNLMLVDGNRRLVILDFGLARPLAVEENESITGTGALLGTLDWMAPEQLHGICDIRSDIYSGGLILYRTLIGSCGKGDSRGLAGALHRASEEADFESQLPPDLPKPMRSMLTGCLQRDPEKRWQSAAEVKRAMQGAAPWRRPKFRIKPPLLALPLLLLAAVALFLVYFRHPQQAGVPPGSIVVVAPTMNATGESRFDGVTEALRGSLVQSSFFNVWSLDRLPAVLRSMRKSGDYRLETRDWREIAFRENAVFTVFSTVSRLGDEYTVAVRCEQTGRNPSSAAQSWEHTERAAGPQGLFESVHRAARWVRTLAGEEPLGISEHNRIPQEVTSASWEALALYSEASRLQAEGKATEAIGALRRALTFDPQFASGLMKVGDLLNSQGRFEEGFAYWQQAIDLSRTQGLSDHERLQIEARYQYEIGDFPAAEVVLRDWVRRFPNDPTGIRLLAACLQELGQLDESIGLLRAVIARFGASRDRLSPLIWGLVMKNRADEVREQANLIENLGFKPLAQRFRGIASVIGGDYERAGAEFRVLESLAEGQERHRTASLFAALAAERGQMAEAKQYLRQGAKADADAGEVGLAAEKKLALAFLDVASGDRTAARVLAWDATAMQQSPSVVAKAVTILARAGFIKDAREVRRKFPEIRGPRNRCFRLRMDGELAAASGKLPDAVGLMEQAARIDSAKRPKEYLARVLYLAGQKERAGQIYRDIADVPNEDWLSPDTEWPGLRYFAKAYLK